MNAEKDYYAILGVTPDADRETIEAAYEALARYLQPDVDHPPADPERLRELDEAFDALDDPARRAEYDNARGIAATSSTGDETAGTPALEMPAEAPARKADRALLLGLGMLVSGIAAVAVGAFVLVGALSDDEDSAGPAAPGEVQVNDTAEGSGAVAQVGLIATVHYTGNLKGGTEFDSSVGGTPFALQLGAMEVIPGFEQGVTGMKVGGERTITIPPDLAYGVEGLGDTIPPNATLVFDIRLLGVSDPPAPSPPDVSGDEIELESGLKAIDIVKGTGKEATEGSTVIVHYSGWLAADGTRFDSSLVQLRPFDFTIGQKAVIRGWDAGVPGMKEGGKRRLIIPAILGYGDLGSPPSIPANADLIFDIELLEVRE